MMILLQWVSIDNRSSSIDDRKWRDVLSSKREIVQACVPVMGVIMRVALKGRMVSKGIWVLRNPWVWPEGKFILCQTLILLRGVG